MTATAPTYSIHQVWMNQSQIAVLDFCSLSSDFELVHNFPQSCPIELGFDQRRDNQERSYAPVRLPKRKWANCSALHISARGIYSLSFRSKSCFILPFDMQRPFPKTRNVDKRAGVQNVISNWQSKLESVWNLQIEELVLKVKDGLLGQWALGDHCCCLPSNRLNKLFD